MRESTKDLICSVKGIYNELDYAEKHPDKVNLEDLAANIKCNLERIALYILTELYSDVLGL